MDDLKMILRCADRLIETGVPIKYHESDGYNPWFEFKNGVGFDFNPLENDDQALWLLEILLKSASYSPRLHVWTVSSWKNKSAKHSELKRAIVLCVAKLRKEGGDRMKPMKKGKPGKSGKGKRGC